MTTYEFPENVSCAACFEKKLTGAEQRNITGCLCVHALMCEVCAVGFYKTRYEKPNFIETPAKEGARATPSIRRAGADKIIKQKQE